MLNKIVKHFFLWCPRGDSNPHGFPHDFESCASASSATRAIAFIILAQILTNVYTNFKIRGIINVTLFKEIAMKQEYLDKLEYNKILKILSDYCKTESGKKAALNLHPSNNQNDVKHMLTETMEASTLIERFSMAPISEIEDISIYIKMLNSSRIINAKGLIDLTNVFIQAKDLKNYFYNENVNIQDFHKLEYYFSVLYTNTSIIDKISHCIIDQHTIADNASKNLYSIRKKIQKLEQDIKDKLNNFIHSSANSKYIQEAIVTIRNDRYVVPVKGEYRSMIKGFAHDISSSGSTVFIEPISIFDINNELSNLKIDESIEIEKILQELSSLFLPYINELQLNFDNIGKLDFIFAKAQYSKAIHGITPKIEDTKKINLINARHPLIDPNSVVPISIDLGNNYSTLLITGPNTGGKTVSLKTIGLLTCMACSGLNIPANEESSLYVFDNIYADIGDNQSIANSLSTFSSHMVNIVEIINNCTPNSLVLIDELGSGTDPIEGANLAISILDKIKKIGSLTVSTTHYQELKKYALVTDGFENASVEFDTESLQPTYRLLIGIPGKSNAFEISKKLGLSEEIIDKAHSLLSSEDIHFEEVLKNIYDDKIVIEKEKEDLEKNLNQVTLLRKQLERDNSDLQKQEKELIINAKAQARDILLQAKDEASEIISKMKEISKSSSNLTELNNLRNKLNESIKTKSVLNIDALTASSNNSLTPEEVELNLPVYVTTLNQEGIIVSHLSKSNEVQVLIGSMKTSINIKYLEKATKSAKKSTSNSASYSKISKLKTVSNEINIIGLTVYEAIPIVDKFLDNCYIAKLQTIRIVHGKGTGKLKSGIHAFLKNHPHVQSYRIGTFGEGEMGVTIVELK